MSDLATAEAMVRAAVAAARAAGVGDVEAKSEHAGDVVTAADLDAEAAMLALVPDGDAVLAEESGARGRATRTWVLDPLDGTANFAAGRPLWCAAAALVCDGAPRAAAVLDGERGELYTAAAGPPPAAAPAGWAGALEDATVACYIRGDKDDPAKVGAIAQAVGALRVVGSGSLELAWVAAGRLDAWLQPRPSPWDWLPGRLLVQAAGGRATVTQDGWHVAGAPAVVEALVGAAPWRG